MPETALPATDLDLISFLKAIPDARMRRGIRIPAWYLLLVAVLGILSRCGERDMPIALELAADLTMQSLLVRFHGQEEVGPLLLELLKNGCWVCNASAWINTPSRSSWPISCLRTARSCFSPVA